MERETKPTTQAERDEQRRPEKLYAGWQENFWHRLLDDYAQCVEERDDLSKKLAAVWSETVADLEQENARLAAENRDMREALALKAIPGEDYRNELRAQVTREALAETKKLRAETAALREGLKRYGEHEDDDCYVSGCGCGLGVLLAPFTRASAGGKAE